MTNHSPAFDLSGSDALRAAFRNHASGISVITALDLDGNPIGFTASSATSLGSNPPLV
ncbi:MAG: flavin reductase, partial [Aquiluna sp.]